MTPTEARLAADLLDVAADEFASHGCNDYARPGWLPQGEWEELAATDEGAPRGSWTSDWLLMRALAKKLRGE